jgi:hypothetical protein
MSASNDDEDMKPSSSFDAAVRNELHELALFSILAKLQDKHSSTRLFSSVSA